MKLKGFTIIEMVMVLFLGTLLMLTLFSIYDWHSKLYFFEQASVRVAASNRATMDALQHYVSQSTGILESGSVSGISYTTSSSTILLEIPSLDVDNNVIPGKFDKTVFYPTGSKFFLRLDPDEASTRTKLYKLINDSLLSIEITYGSATSASSSQISINLQSQQQFSGKAVTNTLLQNLYLKNK